MVAQLADDELTASHLNHAGTAHTAFESNGLVVDERGSTARTIITAMLIASPFWALVALTVYLLL